MSTFSTSVQAGDSFGWRIVTIDNAFGAARTTISNFKVEQPDSESTPEPTSILGLLVLASLGASVTLKRQKRLEKVST